MYKMIFSDLDETLLFNHHVSKVNCESIKKARKNGIKFVPTTGRPINMIQEILKEIGTYNCPGEYSIGYNGGMVVENENNRILHFVELSHDDAEIIFYESIKRNLCTFVFTIDCCYIYNPTEYEVRRKIAQKAPFKLMSDTDFSIFKNDTLGKIMISSEAPLRLRKFQKDAEQFLTKNTSISPSAGGRYLECTASGVTKGSGLLWLTDFLKISPMEVIAIGDNYNDESMILEAGLGACVSSAVPQLKTISDYICEKDYNTDAVAEVIEKFISVGGTVSS